MDLFQVLQVEALALQDYGHHLLEGKGSWSTTGSVKLRNLRGVRSLLRILLELSHEGWEVYVWLEWARRWSLCDLYVREHHVESLCLPHSYEIIGLPLSRQVDDFTDVDVQVSVLEVDPGRGVHPTVVLIEKTSKKTVQGINDRVVIIDIAVREEHHEEPGISQ